MTDTKPEGHYRVDQEIVVDDIKQHFLAYGREWPQSGDYNVAIVRLLKELDEWKASARVEAKAADEARDGRKKLREALELFKPLIDEDRSGMISDEYRNAIEMFDKALAEDDEHGK